MNDVLDDLNKVFDSLYIYNGIIKENLEKIVPKFNFKVSFVIVNGFPKVTVSLLYNKVIAEITFLSKDGVFRMEKVSFFEYVPSIMDAIYKVKNFFEKEIGNLSKKMLI